MDDAGKLVQVAGGKCKKKQIKVKGPTFKVQEYEFSQPPEGSTKRYRSNTDIFEKYKENKDITMNESLKLYAEVRKACGQEVSLVSVTDHKHNTLNLAIDSRSKVAKMKINLDDSPVPDMIHLHKQTGVIIHTDLVKSILKISKLQTSKSRIENQLRQEKIENRAHQAQMKKLQTYLLLDENEADIPVPDMIHLHKKRGDIVHTNLLKSTLKISKLQTSKSRIENQIRQEKVENRAH